MKYINWKPRTNNIQIILLINSILVNSIIIKIINTFLKKI